MCVRKAFNVLPWRVRFTLPNTVNCAITARLVRRSANRLPQPVVLWIYDPGSAPMIGACGEELAVYDCVDDYVEQYGLRAEAGRSWPTVTESPRSGLDSSSRRVRRMYERHRRSTHGTPSRVERRRLWAFRTGGGPVDRPGRPRRPPRPVLGFAGNFLLVGKVDFELLERIAQARREWTLLLMGR